MIRDRPPTSWRSDSSRVRSSSPSSRPPSYPTIYLRCFGWCLACIRRCKCFRAGTLRSFDSYLRIDYSQDVPQVFEVLSIINLANHIDIGPGITLLLNCFVCHASLTDVVDGMMRPICIDRA